LVGFGTAFIATLPITASVDASMVARLRLDSKSNMLPRDGSVCRQTIRTRDPRRAVVDFAKFVVQMCGSHMTTAITRCPFTFRLEERFGTACTATLPITASVDASMVARLILVSKSNILPRDGSVCRRTRDPRAVVDFAKFVVQMCGSHMTTAAITRCPFTFRLEVLLTFS